MVVTKIEPFGKMKFKVYIDEQFSFVLYKGELSRYDITQGAVITTETIEEIKKNVLVKRAKLRAMHLLNAMSRTESSLRSKLSQGGYPADIVDIALEYVKSFGYIEDDQYAQNYIQNKKETKSRQEIRAGLIAKGVPKDKIDIALEKSYGGEDEIEAIKAIVHKKKIDIKNAEYKEVQKLYGYLMRKGFGYENIRQVIHVSDWNA